MLTTACSEKPTEGAEMIALLLFGLAVASIFGSAIVRLVGVLTVLGAVAQIPFSSPAQQIGNGAAVTAGLGIWLLGHWMWSHKHRTWRSQLALAAFSRPGLRLLAPIPTNHIPKTRGPQWVHQNGVS